MGIGKIAFAVFAVVIGFVVLAAAFNLVAAVLVQMLWNYVAPVFHAPELGYWHTWCVLTLLSIVSSYFTVKPSSSN